MRASEPNAPVEVRTSVTYTGTPAARSASRSTRRFSSWLATTRSGRQRDDRGDVGVLRAAHAGDVEVGGMGAPVGGPDEQRAVAVRHGLGERRHDADDSSHPIGRRDRAPLVVDDHGARVFAAGVVETLSGRRSTGHGRIVRSHYAEPAW